MANITFIVSTGKWNPDSICVPVIDSSGDTFNIPVAPDPDGNIQAAVSSAFMARNGAAPGPSDITWPTNYYV